MGTLRIPWGHHEEYGIVSPSDERLEQGLRCGVTCVECEGELVRADGPILVTHFRHYSTVSNENHCAESAVHARAKYLLSQAKGRILRLPIYILPIRLPRTYTSPPDSIPLIDVEIDEQIDVQYQTDFRVVKSDIEVTQTIHNRKKRRPDVILENELGQKVAVEIRVTNAKGQDYIDDMNRLGIPVVEIEIDRETEYSMEQLIDKIARLQWLVEPKDPLQNASPKPIDMGIAGSQGSGERGGWAVVFKDCDAKYIRMSGAVPAQETSKGRVERNRMLLGATIKGTTEVPPSIPLNIYTDNRSLELWINEACRGRGKGKANSDFIGILKDRLRGRQNIRVIHVEGWDSPQYALIDEARAWVKAQVYQERVETICKTCRTMRHPPEQRECNSCHYERSRNPGAIRMY